MGIEVRRTFMKLKLSKLPAYFLGLAELVEFLMAQQQVLGLVKSKKDKKNMDCSHIMQLKT